MLSHKKIIAQLFQNDDLDTVRIIEEQLRQNQPTSQNTHQENALLYHLFKNCSDLENVCWTLARYLYPEIDIHPYQIQLQSWGREFLVRCCEAVSHQERIQKLVEFLYEELGFQGNTENYYNEENSLLPSVIDTRRGTPLSLALIYIFIAERAGMKVYGINLPGHFIVKHGSLFFDPFHKGKILNKKDCEAIFNRQWLTFSEHCLHPATSHQIFIRMIINLLYVYDLTGDRKKHTLMNSWIQTLVRPFQS